MDSRVMPTNSLLIRNIHTLVLMDAENQVLRGGYIYAENGDPACRKRRRAPAEGGPRHRRPALHRPAWPGEYSPPSVPDPHPRLCSRGGREVVRLAAHPVPDLGKTG